MLQETKVGEVEKTGSLDLRPEQEKSSMNNDLNCGCEGVRAPWSPAKQQKKKRLVSHALSLYISKKSSP